MVPSIRRTISVFGRMLFFFVEAGHSVGILRFWIENFLGICVLHSIVYGFTYFMAAVVICMACGNEI